MLTRSWIDQGVGGGQWARSDHRPGSQLPVTPPTLADVAERAGVSRQTVSNAVNNPDLLRPDTLERVRQTIDELGYSPNRAARNLRTRTSSLIGLRFAPAQEGTANATMDRFVHSLVEASEEAGYHVLLFPGDDEDPVGGYDNLLRSTAVDAFVVTDTYLGNPQAAWLSQQRAPFVAFGRPWDDDDARHVWVDVDGAAGTRLATQHLIDRGHTRIAWIGWRKDSPIGEDRRSGWLLDDARPRPVHDRSGLPRRGRRAQRRRGGRRAPRRVARPPRSSARPTPSPWGCSTRSGSASSRPAATSRWSGFDDSQVAQVFPVGLTSVRQPLEDVAVEIVRTLRALLSHQPVEHARRPARADAGDPRVHPYARASTGSVPLSSSRAETHRPRGDAVARRDDDFVAFVDARSAALLRTARLLTAGDQHAAEDLVQTALEKAYVAWPRIQRKGAQEAYVRSIMTRAAIDRTRQRTRRGEVVTDEVPDVPVHQVGPEDRDHGLRAAARTLAASARGAGAPLLRRPLRGADRRRRSAAAPARSSPTPRAPWPLMRDLSADRTP